MVTSVQFSFIFFSLFELLYQLLFTAVSSNPLRLKYQCFSLGRSLGSLKNSLFVQFKLLFSKPILDPKVFLDMTCQDYNFVFGVKAPRILKPILCVFYRKLIKLIFWKFQKMVLLSEWTIYKHVSDKSQKCLSVGLVGLKFRLSSVVCNFYQNFTEYEFNHNKIFDTSTCQM